VQAPPRRERGVRSRHAAAVLLEHARGGTQVGIPDNANFYVPVIETPEHIAAARTAVREQDAMFLTAVMEGRYTDGYLESEGKNAPRVAAGDMATTGSPLDFVALNIYAPNYVRADMGPSGYKILPRLPSSPRMASPWLHVGPEVAY
jgi:beta-glucosidase